MSLTTKIQDPWLLICQIMNNKIVIIISFLGSKSSAYYSRYNVVYFFRNSTSVLVKELGLYQMELRLSNLWAVKKISHLDLHAYLACMTKSTIKRILFSFFSPE